MLLGVQEGAGPAVPAGRVPGDHSRDEIPPASLTPGMQVHRVREKQGIPFSKPGQEAQG